MKRRQFMKAGLITLAAAPAASLITGCFKSGGDVAPPDGMTAIDPEGNPTAKALGYYEDATKVDVAKYPKKGAADGAGQNCENCQFYQAKNEGWGVCQLIQGGVVKKGGWCNSWAKKVAAS